MTNLVRIYFCLAAYDRRRNRLRYRGAWDMRGNASSIASRSRDACRRSGILNPVPQSLQRYFLLPVRKIITLSNGTSALISRFSDRQMGQQFRMKPGMIRAAPRGAADEGFALLKVSAGEIDPVIGSVFRPYANLTSYRMAIVYQRKDVVSGPGLAR